MSITKGQPVPKPESVPGLTPLFDADGDNTAQACSTTEARLYALSIANINAADAWVQFHNVAAGSVVVGTTTPAFSIFVPKGDATNYGAVDMVFEIPVEFSTAISYVCSTTATGAGDPSVGLIVNLFYAN